MMATMIAVRPATIIVIVVTRVLKFEKFEFNIANTLERKRFFNMYYFVQCTTYRDDSSHQESYSEENLDQLHFIQKIKAL